MLNLGVLTSSLHGRVPSARVADLCLQYEEEKKKSSFFFYKTKKLTEKKKCKECRNSLLMQSVHEPFWWS